MPVKSAVSNFWTARLIAGLGVVARWISASTPGVGVFLRLFLLVLSLGSATPALSADKFCSEYPGHVLDGNVLGTSPVQVTIDTDCSFLNWPQSNPLTATLNFQTNDPSTYFIVFDNVYYTGNMACSNIDHKLWFSNGSYYGANNSCQALFIPIESIEKKNPAGQNTAAIGVPFTYTLTAAVMFDPATQSTYNSPSPNDLYKVSITDDLTASGADLTYLSNNAYLVNGGSKTPLGSLVNTGDDKLLTFSYTDNPALAKISANSQIVLEITVVLDDTAKNVAGTSFVNTAKWWFARSIDVDDDGVIEEGEVFEPLPGEWGITQPMTIAAPDLQVTKTGPDILGGINLGEWGEFAIDVRNAGLSDAWNVTLLDRLPDGINGGMCDMTPQVLSAQILAADGVTPVSDLLNQGSDFSFAYSGAPSCELNLTMLTAAAVIGPDQHLKIRYQTKLDADSTINGVELTNIAGATHWFSADSSHAGRRAYARPLTDGTVGTLDHEDAHNVMVALSGLFFEKTVEDLTTGKNPATAAAPGDTLRYRLRLHSIDQAFTDLTFHDDLGALNASAVFVPGSLTLVSSPPGADLSGTAPSGGINGAGILDAQGLNVPAGGQIEVVFDITLASGLAHGTVISNQADLLQGINKITVSDDPNVNGQANPDPAVVDEDPTRLTIQTPQPPLKSIVPPKIQATIGEEVVYQITVPGTPYAGVLNNVVVYDTLDPALVFAGAVSGTTPLTNTSSLPGQVTLPIGTIGAGQQVIITLTARVADLPAVNAGDTFSNTASYTYTGGVSGSSASTPAITVVEPSIVPTKDVTPAPPATPTAGAVLTYTITLPAREGSNFSPAFDVAAVDTLSLGLRYRIGTTTINSVSAPDPVLGGGNGISASQTLTWADLDIPAGATFTITYEVEVLNSVIPGQTLGNSVAVQWTSLAADSVDERTYAATAAAPALTTPPDSTTIAKTRLSDTYNPDDSSLRIGDLVDYKLRLGLQEGTHTGLLLTDTLPTGMVFEAVVSADFFGSPGVAAPTVEGQTLSWNLGTVVNPGDGNPANDYLTIVYRARVRNGDALAQQNSTSLSNSATLDYTLGGAPAAQLTASDTVTVLQPLLAVSKSAAPAGGDTVIDAGEAIIYSVDIINRGAAPAYDTMLMDTLPPGMRQGGITTISVALVAAGTSLPPLAPAYDAASGVAAWNLDNGTADVFTIPPGETLRVVYRVTADTDLGAGLTLTNAAAATLYYSFDDEAVPAGGTVGQREVYGPTNTATANLTTPVPGGPLKQNPADTAAVIGQEFTYTITVPAVPQPTALHDVRILDDLGAVSASLTLVRADKVAGSQAWTPVNTGSGSALVIEDTTSGIEIPANEQIIVGVTVRMSNVVSNAAGLSFSNAASYTFNRIDGDMTTRTSGGSSATAEMTVQEPNLTAAKVAGNATPGKAAGDPVTGGDIIEYVVSITNNGNATAYDVNVADTLPSALAFYDSFAPTALLDLTPVSGFVATPAAPSGGTLTWGRGNGDDSLDIPAGGTLVLTYRAQVLESTATTFSNLAWIDWTSLDNASVYERTGAGCPATTAPDDYCFGPAIVTTATTDNNRLLKAIVADTYAEAPSTAADKDVRIGDSVTYRLTLNLGEGTTRSVRIQDVLPAGMAYDRLLSITPASGSSTFTYSLAAQPAAGATDSLTWDLGQVVNAPSNDGTPVDPLVLEYQAKVLPNAGIVQAPSAVLTNTATLSYQDTGGNTVVDPTRLVASDALTLGQPVLTVHKAATPAGGDNSIDAGEAITYTVDVVNSGAAPAYDAVLVDNLPPGLRQSGVTTISVTLVTAGTALPVLAPAYDAATGVATWNFDTGTANAYTIPAGETLRLVYRAAADADLGAGLTLTNAAAASLYYSFDDEAIPANGTVNDRQVYGPTDTAQVSLTSPTPGALLKENIQPTAAIGEQFSYRITVPATPVPTSLHDVRILDDLSASAAGLRFVSVAKVSGSGSWTPVNSGSDTNVVIVDTAGGIDIPPGEQAVIELTVELLDSPTNAVGLNFTNTAAYTYNQIPDTPASQQAGLPGSTAPMQIIGLAARKTVALAVDNNGNGLVDPGDVLLYTIAVHNPAALPVTGVVLTDDVPANTTYVADSVTLDGLPVGQPDGGIPPLVSGISLRSAGSPDGTLAAGASALVSFNVRVLAGVPAGTVISNQGYLTSNEQPTEPTDADGNAANGHQPTTIVVGSVQQVMIVKEVSVVGGGAALPGSELDYLVRVTNTGTTPVTNLTIIDDLTPLAGQASYVAGSATLDGATTGLNYAAPVLTVDYAAIHGELLPGTTTTLRFRVLIANGLAVGTRLTNTAQMAWNAPTLTTTASASIDIGGVLGRASLNGQLWHDADFDNLRGVGETTLAGWTVDLFRNDVQIASVITDADGFYTLSGLEPTLTASGQYELRFAAPGATSSTASLGLADSAFSNGMQQISGITAPAGSNLQNLNLPIDPNGVVFDSIVRAPVAGATLTMLHDGTPVDSRCFDDPAQQNQVTLASGLYKFDLNFSDPSCPAGGSYVIRVTPPASGYLGGPSRVIPPVSGHSDPAFESEATPYLVSSCPEDAVFSPAGYCEAQASVSAPGVAVPPTEVKHYLFQTLTSPSPGASQMFNNHIPVDPVLHGAVAITKTAAALNVSKGQMVPYTITVSNLLGAPLYDIEIVDRFPPGFKYVPGSARLDGQPRQPAVAGRELRWDGITLQVNDKHTIQLLLIVGAGVSEGEYVNRAAVFSKTTGEQVSGEATATVRVIPDPTFDCTDVIGKVFDDRNLNGQQDAGEEGLAGVRVATVRGLIGTSDEFGRFHITCAAVPDEDRGSNFILKLDDRSLPTGYRMTTENPRVQRATRGKMLRFNFGATIHRVVSIDIADGAFQPDSTELRLQWANKPAQLCEELMKGPAVLRLSYLADAEAEKLVTQRLNALKKTIAREWEGAGGDYRLTVETEIFWRRGGPPQ